MVAQPIRMGLTYDQFFKINGNTKTTRSYVTLFMVCRVPRQLCAFRLHMAPFAYITIWNNGESLNQLPDPMVRQTIDAAK